MYKAFRRLIGHLRKKLPTKLPVDVRRIAIKGGMDGYFQRRNNKFNIRVNVSLSEVAAIDALLHEWAHARSWKKGYENVSPQNFSKVIHDSDWGIAYAEVYRVFEEFNNTI